MSQRLTHRTAVQHPRWIHWIPFLLLLTFALSLGMLAPEIAPASGKTGSVYQNLQSLLPPGIRLCTHLVLALALLHGGGKLVRALLPPKSPLPSLILAQSLGSVTLLILLTPWFSDLLLPSPMLPAITALVWAQITLIQSGQPRQHTLAAAAGLLAGLAAGLSLFIGLGLLPLCLWLATGIIRKSDQALRRLAFFVTGMLIALLPFMRELPNRLQNLPFSPGDWIQSFTLLYTLLSLGGLLLILLGLTVGTLQKNRNLLTFLFATAMLLKAGHIALRDASAVHTGALLFYPALLCAYGVFRLLKGIESGTHALHSAKAKYVVLTGLILLILLAKLWTALIFHSQ